MSEPQRHPQQQPVGVYLTSTTAPGKTFANRMELAEHYKSNYHKYNLKRREAGLPLLVETDFMARLAAAHAVQLDKQQQKKKRNTDHIKKKNRQKDKHKQQQQKGEKNKQLLSQQEELLDEPDGKQQRQEQDQKVSVQPEEGQQQQQQQQEENLAATTDRRTETTTTAEAKEGDHNNNNRQQETAETIIEIDPRQCLFDRHKSKSVTSNVERMQRKYGFFIPDREYLHDMVGLVGYCHEIIQFEHFCLYCYKQFHTAKSCQQHMISKRHTIIRYEHGYDIENLDVFYDFSNANEEFWNNGNNNNINKKKKPENTAVAAAVTTTEEENVADDDMEDGGNSKDDDNDDEWEDITDDEGDGDDEDQNDDDDDDDDDDLYRGYEEEVTRMGLDVTALGELVFPDGRIIGHRSLRRYYKQKLRNPQSSSTAVAAAQQAAGERLYKGRVYQIGYNDNPTSNNHETGGGGALALARAGIAPGWASGRAGRGILVSSSSGNNNSCYSQVSIYRYRAALRKQRRGELQGKRIHEKTNQNINKMDKKHNRLMNGVSVAHAAR